MKKKLTSTLIIYLISWLLGVSWILWQLMRRGEDFVESLSRYVENVLPNSSYLVAQHLLFIVIGGSILLFQYFRRTFRKFGYKMLLKRFGLYLVLPTTFLIVGYKSLVYLNTAEDIDYSWDESVMNDTGKVTHYFEKDSLHRGMSVFGWPDSLDQSIDELLRANVEWVAVIPFIYQEDEHSLKVNLPNQNGTFSRRDSTFLHAIKELKKRGIKVHLKPHVWLGKGWRSNISFEHKNDWDTWFSSYSERMLLYAQMAQLTNTELLCVGTELRSSIKTQPEAWAKLIQNIREIYDGQLTYAANWYDEYEHIPFWNDLDYIGIQAYFPLSEKENPDLNSIKKGWQPHLKTMAEFSKQHQKPILFTEVGYKSEASATIKPWEWDKTLGKLYMKKSDQTQQLAFEALFQELWDKEWFAGVYIWEWDTRSQEVNAKTNLDFSPRFKPAENVIAKWFATATIP